MKYDLEIMTKFNAYKSYKQTIQREWRLVRSLYRGEFWTVFKKHLKEYTITPDWNYYEYVVQAYQNSIYSGAFIGTLLARREEDHKTIEKINGFINYHWNKWGMKNKFLHIGENGELYNMGPVRIDWDKNKGHIKIVNLNPDEIYLDPNVDDYRDGDALFIERSVNIYTLKDHPDYGKEVTKYIKEHKKFIDKASDQKVDGDRVSFIEGFIRNENGKLDQVFILDESIVLHENLDLPVEGFPVVIYSPSRPDGNPYGNSKLVKIFNTVVALNLIDSMEATQPYRLLNRVRFVNVDGRINMRAFADYGNTPGASFQTRGDPSTIVHYADVPTIPDMTNLKNRLENSIFQVTGVDPYYKGRMTNSLQTTGATQAFQARVTMLTDNSRITALEAFTEELTRIMVEYYIHYSDDRTYKVPQMSATGTNKVIGTHELNFTELDNDFGFDYHITASALLPMNQANLFESAKALYEMQGQYGFKTPVITEEDLIRFSDFPQKDLFLQRITKSKQDDTGEKLIADLTNFASIFSNLMAKGLSEEQAAQQAIAIMLEEKNAMIQDPSLGQGFE